MKNCLGRKGLQFFETLMQTKQERYNTMVGLFTPLNNKFKLQYHETIKSLQLHELIW